MIRRIFKRIYGLFTCPDCDATYVGSNPDCRICADFRNNMLF